MLEKGRNVVFWLTREVPTTSAPRPVYPQEETRGRARASLCGDLGPGDSPSATGGDLALYGGSEESGPCIAASARPGE